MPAAVIDEGIVTSIKSVEFTNEFILKTRYAAVIAFTELFVTEYEAVNIEIGVIPVILLAMHAAISLFPSFLAIISMDA